MGKTTADSKNYKIFSKNLHRYVELSGKTQAEIAKVVDVSRGTFNDWMHERAYPRIDKLQNLADFFDIELSDLIEDDNIHLSSEAKKLAFDLKNNPMELDFLSNFRKLSAENKKTVLMLIKTMNITDDSI